MAARPPLADRIRAAWRERAMAIKALSFAAVGVINAAVDYAVFFIARAGLSASPQAVAAAERTSSACGCLDAGTFILIPANLIAWLVAVSGSYVMNSLTTFAKESGGELRWRAYGTFVVSGIAGVIANTATVIAAVQVMPVWAAKLAAILVGFVVNFTLTHFVVFRARG